MNKPIATALISCTCTLLSITAGVADERRLSGAGASEPGAGQKGSIESVGQTQLVQKFNSGDYANAAKIAEIVVKHNDENGVAHYYYASALAKLNRKEEALSEFRKAYNRTDQPTLKSYCEQAIEALSAPESESHTAPSAAAPSAQLHNGLSAGGMAGSAAPAQHTAAAPTSSAPAVVEAKPSNVAPSLQERDLLERKASILEEGANQIDHLRQVAGEDIQKLKKNVADQMVDVPHQIRGARAWVVNPDYAPTLARLNAEAQENIDRINERLAKETSEITDNCNRRTAAYDETMPNMTSQLKPGKSQIQMTPQNSNPYLRNFINYDGSIPGALKAKAGTLPADTIPPSKQKDH